MTTAALERPTPVAVVAIKETDDGPRRVLFSRSPTRQAAEETVAALKRWNLRAEIAEDVAADVRPGEAIR